MHPIVVIVADIREFDGEVWHCVPDQYMMAVCKTAKLLPLFVPALGANIDFDALLDRVDGVMLTGSKANVHPSNYGVEPHERYEPYDQRRDATTLPLARAAVEKGVPLFAICRGIQELNVAFGGSLKPKIQDDDGMLDHRAPETQVRDDQFAMAHSVTARKDGCLVGIIGARAKVNSLHSQAIGDLASQLQVEAIANEDGTVEAVSVIGAKGFAIGVQWHPEYWAESDFASRRLFEAFGGAVRDHARSRL
ncbi:MAG: gamma-glutamyl-gamma-aminobutyrate hydrolase family protein [Granulosicoccus sp.]